MANERDTKSLYDQNLYEEAIPPEIMWWMGMFMNSQGIREGLEDKIEQVLRTEVHDVDSLLAATRDPSLATLGTILASFFTMRVPLTPNKNICLAYLETPEIKSALRVIEQYSSTRVPVRQELKDILRRRYGYSSMIQSIADMLGKEGVAFDWAVLRSVIAGTRKPRSPIGKVVRNYARFMEEERIDPRFTWDAKSFGELWTILHEGTMFASRPPYESIKDVELIESLCHYANQANILQRQHPVVVSCFLQFAVLCLKPFTAHNSFMARLLFQMNAAGSGYEFAAMLPLSISGTTCDEIKVKIENALNDQVTGDSQELYGYRTTIDMTALLTQWLKELTYRLEALYSRAQKLEDFTDELMFYLASQNRFNSRQLTMVGRALRSPQVTFMISYHQRRHSLGYATAHRDFQELVNAGFFTFEKRSNPTVYRAVPDLEKRLAALKYEAEHPQDKVS